MPGESLFNISERIDHLRFLLDQAEEDPEQADHIQEYLVGHEGDLAEKIDNYAWYYRELVALADARKAEAKRLSEAARYAQNRADMLKRRVIIASEVLDRKKLTGKIREIVVSDGGFSVTVTDEDQLSNDFKELIPAQLVPRMKMISDHIKATGEVPEGVETKPIKRVRFK